MQNVAANNDFRITIPKGFRESLGLEPGQKMIVMEQDNVLQLIPVPPISEGREMLNGIDTTVGRDLDRF